MTLEANLVRYKASSTALFPPPTTITFCSLKKKPSQVAQAETPNPLNFSSLFKLSHLAWAPVAMITDFDKNSFPDSVIDRKGFVFHILS